MEIKTAQADINRRGVVILFIPSPNYRCFLRCLDEDFCKPPDGDICSWWEAPKLEVSFAATVVESAKSCCLVENRKF